MGCLLFAWYLEVAAQNVGIGTTSPNQRAILDLTSTDKVFLPPRMTTQQMNAIALPPLGSMVYNTDLQQFMGFVRSHVGVAGQLVVPVDRWLPISTGPRMLAWGIVDSFANTRNGSNNFSVIWNATDNYYELNLTGTAVFNIDSMILQITPIGTGSWDQMPSVYFTGTGSQMRATIKFTDASRVAGGWTSLTQRRRSWFSFTLYDLRTQPF